jgi:TPR repeat protein
VDEDPAAARHWYEQAAAGGHADAMDNLREVRE